MDDPLGGFRQGRQFQGIVQPLSDAQTRELFQSLVDLLPVFLRVVQVNGDALHQYGKFGAFGFFGQGTEILTGHHQRFIAMLQHERHGFQLIHPFIDDCRPACQ